FFRPFISSLAFPYLNSSYSFCLLAFLAAWIMRKGLPLEKLTPLKKPLVIFCLGLTISTFFSTNIANSLGEIYKYLSGILIFITALTLTDKDKTSVIRFILLSAAIIGILSIYQYFFGFRHISEYLARRGPTSNFILDYIQSRRVFFPFVTPNILGGYLAMVIPLAFIEKKHSWVIIPLFLALLLTGSLGALVSLFCGLVLYLYLKTKGTKKKLVLILALSAIVTLVFILRSLAGKQHLTPLFSTTMRLNYWLNTLKIIAAYPLFGTGPGNFNLIDSRYAHNSYLQIWAELGILSLVSFIWLAITGLKQALRSVSDKINNRITICLISSAAIFLIHNLADFSFFLPEASFLWWIILGIII
ncbi:MAG: O-antigen ligase family protein, partial [Candidatus Omnitrophica bacterium]|nr:O-antigen ligase family protein [Candidatus Omnitrophota bacterium]